MNFQENPINIICTAKCKELTMDIQIDDSPVPSLPDRTPVGEEHVADVPALVTYPHIGDLDGRLPILACGILE